MIKIHIRNNTKSIIVNNDIFDEQRNSKKYITFLGITVWKRDLIHNIQYTKVNPNEVTPIGFKKRRDEEAKEK